MNEATPPKEERVAALNGLGTSRKRVEDARFTQGKGNYVCLLYTSPSPRDE